MAASTIAMSGLAPLAVRVQAPRRTARAAVACKAVAARKPLAVVALKKEHAVAAVAPAASALMASPAFAATQEVAQVADTNILGLIACALFVIIPTSFLITLFVKSESDGNRSGGFSQSYYTESKKAGKKKTNLAAKFKGKGEEMYSQD
eukprot:CAMPEP_0118956716 /NCGR_PEP_ID=MMETSP1169-20130426/61724_1 /TAXON_ID=36882 /ORGANISM="Pyramimonas obovata, Strain CCMP722" /LENGTH=148 /DNA_ID=CAMNT_0006904763 /DNA_START=606 /DNA_END=1052 /DNA_ORIENTATION=-